jgi:CRISPR-associated protein Cas5h
MWPERVLVFDISGPVGHFRKPYSPMSPVTYPFPPPTAVFGMVGAICGYAKDEYLDHINAAEVAVGIRLLRPTRKFRAALNLLNTKGKAVRNYFRPTGENPRIQIPHEFLRDPAFRIYFASRSDGLMSDLGGMLETASTAYTPCLGLSECIAQVQFVGEHSVEPIGSREPVEICTVLDAEGAGVRYDPGGRYQRVRVSARMQQDRTVTRYTELLVETEARAIRATPPLPFDCNGDAICFV